MASDDARDWQAAGLYDPAAADATERLALLEYLVERGATLDDLRRSAAEDRPWGLAGDLRRRGIVRLTARQFSEETGLDPELVLRVSRSAGLPVYEADVPIFRRADAEGFRIAIAAMEVFGEHPTLEFTRAIGAAVASIADASMTIFGTQVAERFDERGVSQLERAAAVEASSAALTDQVPIAIETLLFHHVEAALGRGVGGHTTPLAVGFVDLVRSTALVEGLAPDALAEVIGTFERLAVEIVGERGGRVVKTIGDEVMFVLPDPGRACDAALALRDAVMADERLPLVRGGLAFGDLVRGYGDFYGPEVTMAARVVQLAEPGQLLVTAGLRSVAGAGFRFEPAGTRPLRGFSEPVELSTLDPV
ncbi:MAG: adenylate cyclase regulatory domain-containing protein [Acidimicrobiia bacterium]